MNIKLKQKLGGVGQFVLVPFRIKRSDATARIKSDILHIGLIVLLLACMVETSIAELPQNNLEVGDHGVGNAFGDASASHGIEAPPEGDTAESSPAFQPSSPPPLRPSSPLALQPSNPPVPQPSRPSAAPDTIVPKPSEGDIVIQLFNGRGFALIDNEKNVLMMNIDLIKDVDPVYLRDLMTSKKSIEDIKGELRAAEGTTAIRGSLGINESTYPLMNIELLSSTNNSTIVDADVAKLYLKPDDTIDKIVIAGHIKVTVTPTEDGLVGKGELAMSSDEYNGKYTVLLHMEKPLPSNIPPVQGNLTKPD